MPFSILSTILMKMYRVCKVPLLFDLGTVVYQIYCNTYNGSTVMVIGLIVFIFI